MSIEYDQVTILSCMRPLLATKVHRRTTQGSWTTRQYSRMGTFAARVARVHTPDEAWRLMRALESEPRSFLVRDLPREGENLARMSRRINTMAPQQMGLRLCCFDLDELLFEAVGVSVDPTSRLSLEAALKAFIAQHMPAGLQEASCWYQWSNSAGVKPWTQFRCHLWYWLDRPIYRESIKPWAKETPGIDPCLYDSVRVHYTASPSFEDALGGKLPDIMGSDERGSLRSGLISGKTDTATAPDDWLDKVEFDARALQSKLDRAEEHARRVANQKRHQATPEGARTLEGRAEQILSKVCDDLDCLPGTDRHGYVRAKIRFAFGLRDLLDLEHIASEVTSHAVGSLEKQGGRSHKVAADEVARIVRGCRSPAVAPAIPIEIRTKDIRQRQRDKLKPLAVVDPDYLTPDLEKIAVEPPQGTAWPAPAEGWIDRDVKPLTLDEGRAWLNTAVISALASGGMIALAAPAGSGKSYAAKQRALIDPTQDDERSLLIAPTLRLCAEAAEDLNAMARERGLLGWRAVVSASRRGPQGDEPAACHYHHEVAAASALAPDGASVYCKRCELHPDNIGERDDSCPFFKQIRREKMANVVVQTHARFALQEPFDVESQAVIAWQSFELASAVGPRARIILQQTDKQWRASFLSDDEGVDLPELKRTASGNLSARVKDSVVALVADQRALAFRGESCALEIRHQYCAAVLDEDPSGSMVHGGSLGIEDIKLLLLQEDIELSEQMLGRLMHLLIESEKDPEPGKPAKVYSSQELLLALPPAEWKVSDSYVMGRERINAALSRPAEERKAHMVGGVPWRTIEALSASLANEWGCASIKGGRLLLSHCIPLDLTRARTVIHLDATTSEARARALLGDDATFRRLQIEWPDQAKVTWVPCNAGSRSRLIDAFGAPGGRRVPLIWLATLHAYGMTPESLIVTRKSLREEGKWTMPVLECAQDCGAAVMHHRGPGGRGLNEYQNRSVVIIDPWHIPRHVIEQQAWHWCHLACHDWRDEAVREYWRREAGAQLLSAEVLQEIARIRHLSACDESPKKIIILDSRDPRSLGLPLDVILDPDRLVYETLGIVTGVDTAPAILRKVVEFSGGIYAPTLDRLNAWKFNALRPVTGSIVPRQRVITDVVQKILSVEQNQALASDVVCNWTANHGSWQTLSIRSGVQVLYIESDRPGPAIPVFYTKRITRQRLESWLRPHRIKRYRVKGHLAWLEPAGIDHALTGALFDADVELVAGENIAPVVSGIALRMETSERTIYRHLSNLRAPDETSKACLFRLLQEAQETAQQIIIPRGGRDNHALVLPALERLREVYQRSGVLSPYMISDAELYFALDETG